MSDVFTMFDQMRAWVREYVFNSTYALVRFTTIATTNATGVKETVRGQPLQPNENGGTSQENVRRLPGVWGVWSRPPAGEPCIVVRVGGGATNGAVVACGSDRFFPGDLDDGETALYNKVNGTTIKLDAGGDVVVNGGSQKVARVNDSVDVGTLTAVDSLGGHVHFTYTAPGGLPAIDTTATLSGVIISGAPHFKG